MENMQELNRISPPEFVVRTTKASFGLRKVVPFPSGRLDLAILQFDSLTQGLVAGVRSGGQSTARQLLYKSGSVCIDMHLQTTPGSESVLLIGQLLDSLKPGHGIGGIPVSLLRKGGTVEKKRTNDAGEFDFGVETMRGMQLVFGIGESRTIVVSVPDATTASGTRIM